VLVEILAGIHQALHARHQFTKQAAVRLGLVRLVARRPAAPLRGLVRRPLELAAAAAQQGLRLPKHRAQLEGQVAWVAAVVVALLARLDSLEQPILAEAAAADQIMEAQLAAAEAVQVHT
jgi:hypothetical protein